MEFGNWVKQGKDDRERQWMLNQAYDVFHDLADVLGVPTKALSLNGSLGLGFGSRGRGGRAAAHFEPDLVVINLTKTQGTGNLAHEWFHALDNYFSRMREGRDFDFITNKPQADWFVLKDTAIELATWRGDVPFSRAYLESKRNAHPDAELWNPENWIPQPGGGHPEGVRPAMEAAFGKLVDSLDKSQMNLRADLLDKGRNKPYWSQAIERAARAFENYVIAKLDERGHHNDYLANVVPPEVFVRAADRYPYLKPEEMPPVKDAFDNLFATAQTRETDKGVALFSQQRNGTTNAINEAYRRIERAYGGRSAYTADKQAGRTRLERLQWVTARTLAFKQWFGDWEAVRGLRTLEAQRPLDLGEAPPAQPAPANADEVKAHNKARQNAIRETIRALRAAGGETNDHDGRTTVFPSSMAGKIAGHRGFDVQHIVAEFGRLYKSAVPMFAEPELLQEGHKDHTRNFAGYRQYVNRFTQSGEEYYIRFTVQQTAGAKEDAGQTQMHSSFVSEVRIYNGKGAQLTHVSFRVSTTGLTEAERLVTSNVPEQAEEVKLNKDDKLADWLAAARCGVSAAVG